ncbi:hypothetical protein N7523_002305 [Penicillium sp. IBT 18751x]|nr:hypothetical protein N7523_002305 [Penicillium sp. IBT 18751x]
MAGENGQYKERVRNLDFMSRSEDLVYSNLATIPNSSSYETFERHHTIIDERKTFVRHRKELDSRTVATEIDVKIKNGLGDRYPVPIESVGSRHGPPSLLVMIRGARKENFQKVGDGGSYQFISHGHVLRVSEKERDIILGFLQCLFEPAGLDLYQEKLCIESALQEMRMRTEKLREGKLCNYVEVPDMLMIVRRFAEANRGDQLISKLEERHSDICKYEADSSAPPESEMPFEAALISEAAVLSEAAMPSESAALTECLILPESVMVHEDPVPPEAAITSETAVSPGAAVPFENAVPPDSDVSSSLPQNREISVVNSCLFDPRSDIEYESPQQASTTVVGHSPQPDTHDEPTVGSTQNITSTDTSSVIHLREVQGNSERESRHSLGTRNAKKLKTRQTYRNYLSGDFDEFDNSSDTSEAEEDTTPIASGKKRPRKSLGQRGPNKSEKEKKYFYHFIKSRRDKSMSWEDVMKEYNEEFGTNRSVKKLRNYMTRENTSRNRQAGPPALIRAQRIGGAFGNIHASPGQHRLSRTESTQLNVEVPADGRQETLQ